MFTGLVEEMGVLRSMSKGKDSARLSIEAKIILEDLKQGDSISVNGVCLTVTSYEAASFKADVMAETLARTNLGQLKPGGRVNLERALRLGDRLGGHLVSGHIDGVGTVKSKENLDIATLITISAGKQVMRYVIEKGSIAIDGTSLTVIDYGEDYFTVSLIPHTAGATVLGFKDTGDAVNLEADMIGKYVERILKAGEGEQGRENTGVTIQKLIDNGFF